MPWSCGRKLFLPLGEQVPHPGGHVHAVNLPQVFRRQDAPRFSLRDGLYTLGCTAVFLLLRFVPLAQAAGSLFVR